MKRELVLQLERTLDEFWSFTALTHHNFEREVFDRHTEYYDFENWERLIGLTQGLLEADFLTAEMMELIYTVIALDHSKREVLKFIIDNVSESQFELIVKYTMYAPFPDARVQMAAALGDKPCAFSAAYLKRYLLDDNVNVVAEALNALGKVDAQAAEAQARSLVFDTNELIKTTAQDILNKKQN